MTAPTLNQPVPDFSVAATSGQLVTRAALRGRWVVLYFYPKDNTPGCTTEGQDFRTLHADFLAAGACVLGISRDSLKSHEKFRCEQNFPFELIADTEETLCQLFDVLKLKKLYGKEYLGIDRSTFLLDTEGVLRAEWRAVKVPGHAAEVLSTLQQLTTSC